MSKLLENIYAECFNPVKVKMFDPIERREVVREVPCGKCYHCKITKINEWVTRMVLQSLYSKYVYFGTLTYAVTNTKTFEETNPIYSDINKEHKYLPTPLLLRKDHLQKFFKRFRKNTGKRIQYFACGEYGGTYGRPHFHFIMWSDVSISESEVANSWSEKYVSLGRVELQDMRTEAINIEHSYKYVCKYLQKSEFNYDKLVTKKLHDENIRKNFIGMACTDSCYYEHKKEYIKRYSPFVLCSKRPAIGSRYFETYAREFTKGNFSLFGIKGDYVFPSYFYRKAKETICPYKTISVVNGKPNSCSNIPSVVSMLVELQNAIKFNEDFMQSSKIVRCDYNDYTVTYPLKGRGSRYNITLSVRYFNFYDCKNRYYYYLRENGMYEVCVNKHEHLYDVDISTVIKELTNSYNNLLDAFMYDMHLITQARREDRDSLILSEYKDSDNPYLAYQEDRQKVINNLLSVIELRQNRYNQRKTEF